MLRRVLACGSPAAECVHCVLSGPETCAASSTRCAKRWRSALAASKPQLPWVQRLVRASPGAYRAAVLSEAAQSRRPVVLTCRLHGCRRRQARRVRAAGVRQDAAVLAAAACRALRVRQRAAPCVHRPHARVWHRRGLLFQRAGPRWCGALTLGAWQCCVDIRCILALWRACAAFADVMARGCECRLQTASCCCRTALHRFCGLVRCWRRTSLPCSTSHCLVWTPMTTSRRRLPWICSTYVVLW